MTGVQTCALPILPISALHGLNISLLEDLIYKYLPENEYFYPEEKYTLQTEKFFISELIREKLLNLTYDELPFTTTVKVEEIKDKNKLLYVRAEIYVESHSQKKIIVGKKGNLIKEIGKSARIDIENYFEKRVFLDLFVKIVPNWRNSDQILKEIFT